MKSHPRCPYCLDDLLPDQKTVRCKYCRTPHHDGCFRENDGCVAFGCTSHEQVQGGLSIFGKQSIRISHEPTSRVDFGPFTLGIRRLISIPEIRPIARCPEAYVRLTLENREMREGDMTRGRGVIYVPKPMAYKRVDLYLFQGIQRPVEVAKIPMLEGAGLVGSRQLGRGSHPFYIELQAPPAIPFMDPFQLELCLVRNVFKELRSKPLPVFLLQRAYARPTAEQRIRIAPRPSSQAVQDGPPPSEVPVPPPLDPLPASQAGMPGSANGWHNVPVTSVGSLYDSGGPTGRTLAVRFCPTPGATRKLVLDAPHMPVTTEFPVRVAGGGSLSALNLAIHYELVRPGGGEVIMPGFPAIEETRLLGGGSLDAGVYGDSTGLEFIVTVPKERLKLLSEARAMVAHNAALRLHLALDGIDRRGRVLPPVSRAVTFTSP